jgi:histone H3/H4
MADELDALVLEGHGGALNPEADDDAEDFDRRHAALLDRLKCDVITVAEEVAKNKGCRISPQFAQCLAELTMTYAVTLGDDVHAFAQHRKGKTVTHEDVLLAIRKVGPAVASVNAVLPEHLRPRRQTPL